MNNFKANSKSNSKGYKSTLCFYFLALGMRLLAHEMNGGCLMCLKKRPLIIIRDYGYLLMKATKTIISKVYNVSCNFKLLWRLSSTDTSHTVCILMETSFYSEKQWKKEKIWKWLKKQVSFIFFISFYRLTLKNIILHQTCLILKRCNVNL